MDRENVDPNFQSPVNTGIHEKVVGSGDLGPPVGSSTPNIIIKTEEGREGECASRQGFIEVSTSANGKENVTLKSNASVSRRSHTPELATSGKVSPALDMLNFQSLKNTQNLQQMLRSGNQVFHINVQPPSTNGSNTPPKPVQQMIIVKPDEDAEEIMSKTVTDITSKLNEQAAERLAQGYSPDKETVIEITRIATPSDSYFSKENTKNGKKPSDDNTQQKKESNLGAEMQEPQSRTRHQRKSPLHKRPDAASCLYFSKPTNVSTEYTDTKPLEHQPADSCVDEQLLNNQSYFRPVHAANSHGDSFITSNGNTTQGLGCIPGNPSQMSGTGKRSVTILSRARVGGQNTYTIQTSQPESSANSLNSSSSVFFHSEDSQPDSLGLSMDEDFANDSRDGSLMNDSLTNIHWLGHMKGDNLQVVNHKDMRLIASEKQIEKVNSECGKHKRPPYSYMHLIQMAICSKPDKKMTLKDIYSWIETKFPYYKSNPNKGWRNSIRHNLSLYDIFVREKINIPGKSMVSFWTLRSDFKPKSTPTETEANLDDSLLVKTDPIEPASPVFFIQNDLPQKSAQEVQPCGNPNRKRPVPLLPKPSTEVQQTYALIPIQGGVPVVPSQPIMVPANWSSQYSVADCTDLSADGKSSLKRSASPEVVYPSKRKQIKIAPKLDLSSLAEPQQHQRMWVNCSSSSGGMSGHSGSVYSLDSSDLQSQLSHIRYLDSGFASLSSENSSSTQDISGQQENSSSSSNATFSLNRDNSNESWVLANGKAVLSSSIPQPDLGNTANKPATKATTMTTGRRIGKRKRKSPHASLLSSPSGGNVVNLSDSRLSDVGINEILASIEKDLSSPARQLLKTPTKADHLFTSTPFKEDLDSPSWISPIRGFLLSSDDGGSGGVDINPSLFTPPDKSKAKKTSTPLDKLNTPQQINAKTPRTMEENGSIILYRGDLDGGVDCGDLVAKQPLLQRSPKLGSLRGLGLVGLTPLKSPGGRRLMGGVMNNSSSPPRGGAVGCLGDEGGEDTSTFGKLLGDMHLDSMIEDGMQDMANLSFSQLGL